MPTDVTNLPLKRPHYIAYTFTLHKEALQVCNTLKHTLPLVPSLNTPSSAQNMPASNHARQSHQHGKSPCACSCLRVCGECYANAYALLLQQWQLWNEGHAPIIALIDKGDIACHRPTCAPFTNYLAKKEPQRMGPRSFDSHVLTAIHICRSAGIFGRLVYTEINVMVQKIEYWYAG